MRLVSHFVPELRIEDCFGCPSDMKVSLLRTYCSSEHLFYLFFVVSKPTAL